MEYILAAAEAGDVAELEKLWKGETYDSSVCNSAISCHIEKRAIAALEWLRALERRHAFPLDSYAICAAVGIGHARIVAWMRDPKSTPGYDDESRMTRMLATNGRVGADHFTILNAYHSLRAGHARWAGLDCPTHPQKQADIRLHAVD